MLLPLQLRSHIANCIASDNCVAVRFIYLEFCWALQSVPKVTAEEWICGARFQLVSLPANYAQSSYLAFWLCGNYVEYASRDGQSLEVVAGNVEMESLTEWYQD
jgi:hypothetical protein